MSTSQAQFTVRFSIYPDIKFYNAVYKKEDDHF